MKNTVKTFLASSLLFVISLFSMFFPSCSSASGTGLVIVRATSSAPKLLDIRALSADEIALEFSDSVKALNLSAIPVTESGEEDGESFSCDCVSEGEKLVIKLSEKTKIGQKYKMSGEVENDGNTLTFEFYFLGMNDHRCSLVLSELRDGYSGKRGECEFVELYALSGGNTAGLEIFSASDGEEKSYHFPALEVKAGDFITVHFRSLNPDCRDELGENLDLNANISDTCRTARDLFAEGTQAHFGADSDVILLRDRESGEILDALCYAKHSLLDGTEWKKPSLSNAAEKAAEAGVWQGAGILDSLNADGFTQTHSLARQNLSELKNESFPYPNGAEFWIVSADRKSITPGKPNSNKRK